MATASTVRTAIVAALAEEVAQTLGALTTATVFSAGFLSTRVHRERARALDRSATLNERVAAAVREGRPLEADWFDDQNEALRRALLDRMDRMALVLVLGLGLGVVVLATFAGFGADLNWADPSVLLLLAFGVAALCVVGVAVFDFRGAQREMQNRYLQTAVGRMSQADELLLRAASQRPPRSREVEALLEASELAVRYSYGFYGPAWATLGNAHLLGLGSPTPRPDDLTAAIKCFERGVALGPETAPTRAALAWCCEIRDDEDMAAANWVRAMWLHWEATRPLEYEESAVAAVSARQRASGGSTPVPGSASPAYAWRFFPQLPQTYATALQQIPSCLAEGWFTARKLVELSHQHPDSVEFIIDALVPWLEESLAQLPWWEADQLAAILQEAPGAIEVRTVIAEFRSPDGAIGNAKNAMRDRIDEVSSSFAALDTATKRAEEWQTTFHGEMENLWAEREDMLTRRREEDRARQERWLSGHATQDDRERLDMTLDEVLHGPNGLDEVEEKRRKLEERVAASKERQRIQEAKLAESQRELDRQSRIRHGMATEEDLAAALNSSVRLWPEPPAPSAPGGQRPPRAASNEAD